MVENLDKDLEDFFAEIDDSTKKDNKVKDKNQSIEEQDNEPKLEDLLKKEDILEKETNETKIKSEFIPDSEWNDLLPPKKDGIKPEVSKIENEKSDDIALDFNLNEEDLANLGKIDTIENEFKPSENKENEGDNKTTTEDKKKLTKADVFREQFGIEIDEDEKKATSITKADISKTPAHKQKNATKTIISTKKKSPFFIRLLYYILFIIGVTTLSIQIPIYLKYNHNLWYLPLIFMGIFLFSTILSIKFHKFNVNFYLLTLFNVISISILAFFPIHLKDIFMFINKSILFPWILVLGSLTVLHYTLTFSAFNRKLRLFLSLIGFYGFLSIIFFIKNGFDINQLTTFNLIPINYFYINPFFLFLNAYLLLTSAIILIYLLIALIRLEGYNIFRSLNILVIAITIWLSGNTLYHFNHIMTPLILVKPFPKIKTVVDIINDTKFNKNSLNSFWNTINKKLIADIILKNNALSVIKFTPFTKKGINYQFFPNSNQLCFLDKNGLFIIKSDNSIKNLIKSKIELFKISPSGNAIIYILNNRIYTLTFGKDKKKIVYKNAKDIKKLTCNYDASIILFKKGNKWFNTKTGELFKRNISDINFLSNNAYYYVSWDEIYQSYSIFFMKESSSSPERLIFDKYDKALPTISPDKKHITYVLKQTNNDEIWISNTDGNNKYRLFNKLEKYERVNLISWNYDGSKLLIDTNKKYYILDLNVKKEKSIPGSFDKRLKILKSDIKNLGIKNTKISTKNKLRIFIRLSDENILDSISKVILLTYAYLPEYRNKEVLFILFYKGQHKNLLLYLSKDIIFNNNVPIDWRKNAKWR